MTLRSADGRGTRGRSLFLVAVVGLSIATASLVASVWRTTWHPAAALDLKGRPIDPLGHPRGRATVLVFTRSDCPISNRFAPQVRRLTDRFAPEGVGLAAVLAGRDPEVSKGRAVGCYIADLRWVGGPRS